MTEDKLTKQEAKRLLFGAVVFFIIVFSVVFWYVNYLLPSYKEQLVNYAKEHKLFKTGKIILVIPKEDSRTEGRVYWEDGSIMRYWRSEDYGLFLQYINKNVSIVYGEFINKGVSNVRVLLSIVEEV